MYVLLHMDRYFTVPTELAPRGMDEIALVLKRHYQVHSHPCPLDWLSGALTAEPPRPNRREHVE